MLFLSLILIFIIPSDCSTDESNRIFIPSGSLQIKLETTFASDSYAESLPVLNASATLNFCEFINLQIRSIAVLGCCSKT
jgi:hypothetical protein